MKAIIMPKMGFTMTESTIVAWLKHDGDAVNAGDPIAEVTTDKVNMEVEAPESGTLAGIKFNEGDTVPVTEVIAYILKKGEVIGKEETPASNRQPETSSQPSATPIAARIAAELGLDLALVRGTGVGGKITREDVEATAQTSDARHQQTSDVRYQISEGDSVRATPAARAAAHHNGVDLGSISGSGPNGRVQSADVLRSVDERKTPAAQQQPSAKIIPYSGMRKAIGTRLQQSYQQAPHVTFDVDVDMTATEALRAKANMQLKQGDAKVSLTAMIAKACAWALLRHPIMNSRLDLDAGHIVLSDEVNMGIAVALDEGLVVPVVRGVQDKNIQAVANAIADLGTRAKTNKLKADEMGNGTFTISNLGMFGVDRFTAIINPPETGILAVGRSKTTFVPDDKNQPVLKPILTLRLSADHRVIDGAVAAKFLSDVRTALEDPAMMMF